MAKYRLITGWKQFWITYKKRRLAGFTLTELLVSMLIATMITLGLLSLVIEITDANTKDFGRSQVQESMQGALDYIVEDLREAVFVYDGPCLSGQGTIATATTYLSSCPGIVNVINPMKSNSGATAVPVLAFWRPDPLPEDLAASCRDINNAKTLGTTSPSAATVGVPCVSGRSYTLVVYGIEPRTATDSVVWQGRARLVRYQLPQFTTSTAGVSTTSAGYVDPLVILAGGSGGFQQWPYQLVNGSVVDLRPQSGGAPVIPGGATAVLVDFLDDSSIAAGINTSPTCISPAVLTPSDGASFNSSNYRSFYACVRGSTFGAALAEQGVNQEVLVVLQGNVAGKPGFPLTTTSTSRLFPLQTRVLTRGIINKAPSS